MGSFRFFNDPKEYGDWQFDLFTRSGGFDSKVEQEIQQRGTKFAKDHAKVLCGTVDQPSAVGRGVEKFWGRGFCRPRMWAQYGAYHKGACLIFDKAALSAAIRTSKPAESLFWEGPITYKNTPRVYTLYDSPFMIDYDDVCANGLQRAVSDHVVKNRVTLFFEKAADWRDEQEYRWLIWDNSHEAISIDFGDALKGVVVGCDFDAMEYKPLQALCSEHKVLVKRMTWLNGSPDLEHRVPIE